MNLFWKKLFGQIQSTAQYEDELRSAYRDMKRYDEIDNSAELASYKELSKIVSSPEFNEKKKTLLNRKYKDTEEHRVSIKFQKLSNNNDIKRYYEVLKSDILQQYRDFKKTPEYADLSNPAKVKASAHLSKMKEFENSKDYKLYVRFHDSFIIKDFEALKEKINSPEFKKNNEFWANEHRWKTVPEYQTEQRYLELSKNPDIIFYNTVKVDRFEKYRKLKKTFTEQFDWNTLDKSRWNFGLHSHKNLVDNYSFTNEWQGNSGGKNVSVYKGILSIQTRHEKIKTKAWDPKKGFVLADFDYTSDVIQTATNFRQKYGIFSAKLKCSIGGVHHAFWLSTEEKLPHVNIYHFNGKNITMGNAHKGVMDEIKLTNIPPIQYFVFTLVWTPKELIWYVNNLEVHRTSSNVPQVPMYLGISSFLPKKDKPAIGELDVDWVRVSAFES